MICRKCKIDKTPEDNMLRRFNKDGSVQRYMNVCRVCDRAEQSSRKREKLAGTYVSLWKKKQPKNDGTRWCQRCDKFKAFDQFPSRKLGSRWARYACLECDINHAKNRYSRAKERTECYQCHKPCVSGALQCSECQSKCRVSRIDLRYSRKRKLMDMLGGKCMDCGLASEYESVYDFHHRDPSTKLFEVANTNKFKNSLWSEVVSEAMKCDLLCANCHRIRHQKQRRHMAATGVYVDKLQASGWKT